MLKSVCLLLLVHQILTHSSAEKLLWIRLQFVQALQCLTTGKNLFIIYKTEEITTLGICVHL